jgi:hypothetical protein
MSRGVLLTTRRRLGEGAGDEDGAEEEIDAGGCGWGAPVAVRFGEGRRGPGARDPRASDTCADGRRKELEEVVAGDEERWMARNGAAAGLHGGGACGEGVGGTGECKGGNSETLGVLLRARRGRGGNGRGNGHQWLRGGRRLQGIQEGETLIRGNRRE